ncbi:uroporphyrinogen-III synthase [Aureimonas pseudogalii]|uniref:Uroporphyrinogen-III synthase n=1 Tax=Aureimonas pseudogalii TaxID=1744844 RepID=A0A7W6MLH8_9HYPH|nr:uroporphyrinogen-III synthase [Aureimonas pseudogalii]MBB3999807.1 uroporphyrinogen-III synthase [Aureimonas pseudogalii]
MARVLVVREAGSARETAEALARRGHAALLLPLQEIRRLDPAPPAGEVAGVVATSRHAVPWLAAHRAALQGPAFAVGAATAAHLVAAGFADVRTGSGTAASLPALLAAERASRPFLYAAGRVRRRDLEAGCGADGPALLVVEVYDAAPRRPTREEAEAALSGGPPDAALLLSGEQAEAFAALVEQWPDLLPPALPLHCLSAAVAARLPAVRRQHAQVASGGDLPALLDGIGEP